MTTARSLSIIVRVLCCLSAAIFILVAVTLILAATPRTRKAIRWFAIAAAGISLLPIVLHLVGWSSVGLHQQYPLPTSFFVSVGPLVISVAAVCLSRRVSPEDA
jgi:O-antigen/teichoic acid export membrane protein